MQATFTQRLSRDIANEEVECGSQDVSPLFSVLFRHHPLRQAGRGGSLDFDGDIWREKREDMRSCSQ